MYLPSAAWACWDHLKHWLICHAPASDLLWTAPLKPVLYLTHLQYRAFQLHCCLCQMSHPAVAGGWHHRARHKPGGSTPAGRCILPCRPCICREPHLPISHHWDLTAPCHMIHLSLALQETKLGGSKTHQTLTHTKRTTQKTPNQKPKQTNKTLEKKSTNIHSGLEGIACFTLHCHCFISIPPPQLKNHGTHKAKSQATGSDLVCGAWANLQSKLNHSLNILPQLLHNSEMAGEGLYPNTHLHPGAEASLPRSLHTGIAASARMSSSKALMGHNANTPICAITTRHRIHCNMCISVVWFLLSQTLARDKVDASGHGTPFAHREQNRKAPSHGQATETKPGLAPGPLTPNPVLIIVCQSLVVSMLLQQQIAKGKRKQKADQPVPHILSINSTQSSWLQCSDQTGLAFQQLHPKLTSLFGVFGFEHVLSDPLLFAVAWPPASHVARDDYAEHLLPSDAQLEINTDKNPQISLQNVMVWMRQSKWDEDARPIGKTVLGRETCNMSKGGEVLNWNYTSSLRLPHFSTERAAYVCYQNKICIFSAHPGLEGMLFRLWISFSGHGKLS